VSGSAEAMRCCRMVGSANSCGGRASTRTISREACRAETEGTRKRRVRALTTRFRTGFGPLIRVNNNGYHVRGKGAGSLGTPKNGISGLAAHTIRMEVRIRSEGSASVHNNAHQEPESTDNPFREGCCRVCVSGSWPPCSSASAGRGSADGASPPVRSRHPRSRIQPPRMGWRTAPGTLR
jgi:hypothetical protein